MRALILAIVMLVCASVRAAPLAAPSLHWVRGEGTETCIEPRALAERVEALIGAPLVRAAEAEHSLEGASERTPTGFRVLLRLYKRGGQSLGQRVLETTQDCSALNEAIAFVVAMMIDPEVLAHGLPPGLLELLGEDSPEETLLAELEARPPQPVVLPPAAPSSLRKTMHTPEPVSPRDRAQLYLGAGSSLWSAPKPSLALGAHGVAFLNRWFGLGVSGWVHLGLREYPTDTGATYRVTGTLWQAWLCAAAPWAVRFRMMGCVGPALRVRVAHGEGFSQDQRTVLVSGSAAAMLHARLTIREGWGVAAQLGADVSFSPPSLFYTAADGATEQVYRFAPADLMISVGPTVEF